MGRQQKLKKIERKGKIKNGGSVYDVL